VSFNTTVPTTVSSAVPLTTAGDIVAGSIAGGPIASIDIVEGIPTSVDQVPSVVDNHPSSGDIVQPLEDSTIPHTDISNIGTVRKGNLHNRSTHPGITPKKWTPVRSTEEINRIKAAGKHSLLYYFCL